MFSDAGKVLRSSKYYFTESDTLEICTTLFVPVFFSINENDNENFR